MKMVLAILAFVAVLAGCSQPRSISNSNYQETKDAKTEGGGGEFTYRGELNEFDVLGVYRQENVTDEDIAAALDQGQRLKLRPGSAVLLIQSGTMFPDGPMVAALSEHCRVSPFSGMPTERLHSGDNKDINYSRSLRLAAAQGGCETILCYWGVLESASSGSLGKPINWVPVVNRLVPDEEQHMRLRVKMAVIDVRTGSWSTLSPPPVNDTELSTKHSRAAADQSLVELLKKEAYAACVEELVGNYGMVAAVK
ncbi:MAG: aminopeptidase [Verrucomicrobiota bacterium]